MKKNTLRDFLTKILTASNLTQEIRSEALQLRDTLDELVKKQKNVTVVDFDIAHTVEYDGNTYAWDAVEQCYDEARGNKQYAGKIAFIKELRNRFRIGLKEAKEFSDYLGTSHNYLYQIGNHW